MREPSAVVLSSLLAAHLRSPHTPCPHSPSLHVPSTSPLRLTLCFSLLSLFSFAFSPLSSLYLLSPLHFSLSSPIFPFTFPPLSFSLISFYLLPSPSLPSLFFLHLSSPFSLSPHLTSLHLFTFVLEQTNPLLIP